MPSLYEYTTPVGDVASGDFTTLYNASGLTVPNAGAGSVSGNLNVGGNLTVQGSTLLIGPVALQSTLSLPYYTFPNSDGTTFQVLTTDGSGNLTWSSVQTLPGANYSISASTTTGGANLDLVSGVTTDSVKFAEGNNITITRTDANTITISTVADNIPDGTAQGQVLYWDGSAWTANNQITSLNVGDRLISEFKNSTTTLGANALFRRNFGSTAYSAGLVSSVLFQFDSDSQAVASVGSLGFAYDASNPSLSAYTSTDNFTTRLEIANINSTDVKFDGTNLVLNKNHTGTPTENATITVERGSSTDATITWDETQDRWEVSNGIEVQGQITGTSGLDLNGNSIIMRSGAVSGGNATITVDRGASDASITWNETDAQWELSDPLFISSTDFPATFERKKDTTDTSIEGKGALRLIERVTDAPNNQTDDGGSNIVFTRTSGASGGTEVDYATIQSDYFGTTNKANVKLVWTVDNFTEVSPGVFPGTYTLLNVDSDQSKFFNNSLTVNYAVTSATDTATSITGGNTLVFGSAHGYTAGQRIQFQSASQNGLIQSAYYYVLATGLTTTQCQVSLQSGGTAAALTNGTGLTLLFAEVINRVGINTSSPAYTLDVNGDANVTGDIYISGVQVDINSPVMGDMLYYNGTAIVNDNVISTNQAGNRATFEYQNSTAGVNTSLFLRKNFGATAFAAGDGTAITFQVDSNSQPTTGFAQVGAEYDGTDPAVFFTTSTDNYATNKIVATVDSTNLELYGNEVLLNRAVSGAPSSNASITVNRGSSTDATLTWDETQDRWEISNGAEIQGQITGTANLDLNGNTIELISGFTGTPTQDANIIVNRGSSTDASIIWNETTDQWDLSNDLQIQPSATANIGLYLGANAATVSSLVTTATTSATAITTTTRNTMNGSVSIKDTVTGALHTVQFTALKNGATAMLTTFGELYTSAALATFTADISGGSMRLLATPASSNSTTFNVIRTSLT